MVTALLQTLVTRRFDVFDPVVITVGSFHGDEGERDPRRGRLPRHGALSFSPQSRGKLREATLRLVQNIAAAHGLATEAEYVEGYPVTVNDPTEAQFATATAASLFGPGRSLTPAQPLTGAEDFSYVLGQVPGAFVLAGDPAQVITIADESAAEHGVRFTGQDPADRAPEALPELASQLADGRLTVPVWRAYPLAEAATAHADLDAGRNQGKIILLP